MKLKDIKPGMIVAIGSMRSVNAQCGGGWKGNARRAVIVAKGKFIRSTGWGWLRNPGDTGLREVSDKGAKTTILIGNWPNVIFGKKALADAYPEVVPASKILMPWDEYLEKVEQEKAAKEKAREEWKTTVTKRSEQFEGLSARAKGVGLEISPMDAYNAVIVSFDDLDAFLSTIEKE